MKKYVIDNYYNNLELSLLDSSKNNPKLYWRLLKNVFNIKMSTEIPPLQFTLKTGEQSIAYSNAEKAEVLYDYFSSISFLDDNEAKLPKFHSVCNNVISDI